MKALSKKSSPIFASKPRYFIRHKQYTNMFPVSPRSSAILRTDGKPLLLQEKTRATHHGGHKIEMSKVYFEKEKIAAT
jgi:hypothetical protein